MPGSSISKSYKRRGVSLDVLPPDARRVLIEVLTEHGALGVWILAGELGCDGPDVMNGQVEDHGDAYFYRSGDRWWCIAADDVRTIEAWQIQRSSFISFGTVESARELADWLRGPISNEIRRRLSPAPYAQHLQIGVRLLNATARATIVDLCRGNDALVWELTGRVGVPVDLIEPHSTSRIHRILNEAAEELARDCKR